MNIAVIGGGFSSLTACATLKALGASPLVITRSTGWGFRWLFPAIMLGKASPREIEEAFSLCNRVVKTPATAIERGAVVAGKTRLLAGGVIVGAGSRPAPPIRTTGGADRVYFLEGPARLAALLRTLPAITSLVIVSGRSGLKTASLLRREAEKRGVSVELITRAGCKADGAIEARGQLEIYEGRSGVLVKYSRYKAILADAVAVMPECVRDYSVLVKLGGLPSYLPTSLKDPRAKDYPVAYAGTILEGVSIAGYQIDEINPCSAAATGILSAISVVEGRTLSCALRAILKASAWNYEDCPAAIRYLLCSEDFCDVASRLSGPLSLLRKTNVL